MASFEMELPTEIMQDVQRINDNYEHIFGSMTRAGAEAAACNIRAAAPMPEIAEGIKVSVVYRTPTDDGINTKVYISGYAPFKGNRTEFTRRGTLKIKTQYSTDKGIPRAFLAQMCEYGTSPRYTNDGAYRGYIGKTPFFRKGFKPAQIERIMLDVQRRESGGLLDE